MKFGEFDARAGTKRCIEIGKRLVEQERLGLLDDRTPDGDTLALSAGELRRPPVKQRFHFQHARRFGDPLADDIRRDAEYF